MDELWTLEELVKAVDGTLAPLAEQNDLSGEQNSHSLTSVSIDSRTLEPGALYVAIQGVSQDGHLYVSAAFAAGAHAALVSHGYEAQPGDGVLVRVDDTLAALEKMALWARKRSSAKIVAVTGSAGKTGTKEALKQMFCQFGKTHASVKSFNNHWGVPLSLARMPRDCEFAVFEVGMNHAGEIRPLSKLIQPHIALITTIAPAHIGHFNNEEEIADAKAEVFEGLVADGVALLPVDNQHYERLCDAARRLKVSAVYGFGASADGERGFCLSSAHYGTLDSQVQASLLGQRFEFTISQPGAHIASNMIGALGVLMLAGCDVRHALPLLSSLTAPDGRGVLHELKLKKNEEFNGFTLIDESYNANPPSMEIALKNLSAMQGDTYCRRIAVLGDMLELGAHAVEYHKNLAPLIAELDIDLVFASGEMMAHMFEGLPEIKQTCYGKKSAELLEPLGESLLPGDVIMVKGSLGSEMGLIVRELIENYKH